MACNLLILRMIRTDKSTMIRINNSTAVGRLRGNNLMLKNRHYQRSLLKLKYKKLLISRGQRK